MCVFYYRSLLLSFFVLGASCAKNCLHFLFSINFLRLLVFITVSELIFRQTASQCMPLGQTSEVHPRIHVSISFAGWAINVCRMVTCQTSSQGNSISVGHYIPHNSLCSTWHKHRGTVRGTIYMFKQKADRPKKLILKNVHIYWKNCMLTKCHFESCLLNRTAKELSMYLWSSGWMFQRRGDLDN